MNENVSALLRVDHQQSTNFSAIMSGNVHQPAVADLSTHFSIEWRSIENHRDLSCFLPRQNGFDHSFGFQKIVTEKFCRRGCDFSFNSKRLLFLGFASAFALLVH